MSEAKSRGAVKRRQQATGNGQAGELGAMSAALKEASCEASADYWVAYIVSDEAARFLGTTKGELYNLTSSAEIPFIWWGKRGIRFRRKDLVLWMEARRKPASNSLECWHAQV